MARVTIMKEGSEHEIAVPMSWEGVKTYRDIVDKAETSTDHYTQLVEAAMHHKQEKDPTEWAEEVFSAAEWAADVADAIDEATGDDGVTHYQLLLLIRNLHRLGVEMLEESFDVAADNRWRHDHV